MTGLAAFPASTLVERSLALLATGPQSPLTLAREVLGLPRASPAIADRLAVALLGADPRVRRLPDGRWAEAVEARGSPLLGECAFAVVDVETTGGRPAQGDRIIEIAVMAVHRGAITPLFESLVCPGRPIPWGVRAVTGIDDRMVRGAPPFEAIADRVLEACAGRVFVAHNVRFDWAFLDAELRRARGLGLTGPRLCSVRLARRLLRLRSCSLDSLTEHLELRNPARHRAGGDARVTAEILLVLLEAAAEGGMRSLHELEATQGRPARSRSTRARPG